MKLIKFIPFISFIFGSSFLTLNAQIPAERIHPWDAGVRGGIPQVETKLLLDATDLGEAEDASLIIQSYVDALEGRGAIELPAGRFTCRRAIHLKSGVVLRGQGIGKTKLVFDFIKEDVPSDLPEKLASASIQILGSREVEAFPIVSGFDKGSRVLEVENAQGLERGQMILVYMENDAELMYTDERWNVPWARQSLAQIVEIRSIHGNLLYLDVPLRLDYKASLQPRLRKIHPIEWAGVEDLSIKRIDSVDNNIIGFENARNCWVKGVETEYSTRGHVWMNFSRFLTVEGNYHHHAYNYGGGGHGYGVVAGNIACDNLVINNVFHHLRHAMMTKRGSNGNVFAFNYSFERRRQPEGRRLLCDISIHGHYSYMNLFEGNQVNRMEYADYWGPTGPFTTAFRNMISEGIFIKDGSSHGNLMGNIVKGKGVLIDETSLDTFLLDNEIGGEIDHPLAHSGNLPASLFLSAPPSFWGDRPWPLIQPGEAVMANLPAYDRYHEVLKERED